MTDTMKAILSRLLSQDLAHQEIWGEEDAKMFGEHMNRKGIIQEIKQYMEKEDIKFSQDWYMKVYQEEAQS